MAEYGIGRIPRDANLVDEVLAEVEAERLQPTPKPPRGKPLRTCGRCGQQGYDGAYPFSTIQGDNTCDDCV